MEMFAWRYRPEFVLSVRVNGAVASDFEIIPSVATRKTLEDYGFIVRTNEGILTCFGRRLLSGASWGPVYAITRALSFSFWLRALPEAGFRISELLGSSRLRFGKTVFYANNLSASGEIDAGIVGKRFELIPSAAAINEKTGALSTYTPSANFNPGEYTGIRAGKINAGSAVNFSIVADISPAQSSVGLDLRYAPGEAHLVVLNGSPNAQETVIPDEPALSAGVQGVVTIYKDAWNPSSTPIEYRINFTT